MTERPDDAVSGRCRDRKLKLLWGAATVTSKDTALAQSYIITTRRGYVSARGQNKGGNNQQKENEGAAGHWRDLQRSQNAIKFRRFLGRKHLLVILGSRFGA